MNGLSPRHLAETTRAVYGMRAVALLDSFAHLRGRGVCITRVKGRGHAEWRAHVIAESTRRNRPYDPDGPDGWGGMVQALRSEHHDQWDGQPLMHAAEDFKVQKATGHPLAAANVRAAVMQMLRSSVGRSALMFGLVWAGAVVTPNHIRRGRA